MFTDGSPKRAHSDSRNIKLTCVEPGGFRTDWAGRSMVFGDNKNPAYDHINAKEAMGKRHGAQAGDPVKGARAYAFAFPLTLRKRTLTLCLRMWEIAQMSDPPLRTVIGSDAYSAIMKKIKDYGELYPKYEKLANSTDVDGYERPS